MRVLLLVMLFAVYGASFAQPVDPVVNPGFEHYDPTTGEPSGWFLPANNHAKVHCASGLTPTDSCALVLRAGNKVTQRIRQDWSAGDQFTLNISYRTKGAYTAGVFKAAIAEVLNIGGSYIEAEGSKRKLLLEPASDWTALADDKPYTVMWDTFFDLDTFSGRNLYITLHIGNRSAFGKLLVDNVEIAIIPTDTP